MTRKKPERRDWRALTAALVADVHARIDRADRVIRSSERLMQHSAKLVRLSAFDPRRPSDPVSAARAQRAHQETQRQARQIRMQSGAQLARARRLQERLRQARPHRNL